MFNFKVFTFEAWDGMHAITGSFMEGLPPENGGMFGRKIIAHLAPANAKNTGEIRLKIHNLT